MIQLVFSNLLILYLSLPSLSQSVVSFLSPLFDSARLSLMSHVMTDSTSAPAKFPMPSRHHSPLFVKQIVKQQDCLCCTNQTIDHVLVYSETCKLNIDQPQVPFLSWPFHPKCAVTCWFIHKRYRPELMKELLGILWFQ